MSPLFDNNSHIEIVLSVVRIPYALLRAANIDSIDDDQSAKNPRRPHQNNRTRKGRRAVSVASLRKFD